MFCSWWHKSAKTALNMRSLAMNCGIISLYCRSECRRPKCNHLILSKMKKTKREKKLRRQFRRRIAEKRDREGVKKVRTFIYRNNHIFVYVFRFVHESQKICVDALATDAISSTTATKYPHGIRTPRPHWKIICIQCLFSYVYSSLFYTFNNLHSLFGFLLPRCCCF